MRCARPRPSGDALESNPYFVAMRRTARRSQCRTGVRGSSGHGAGRCNAQQTLLVLAWSGAAPSFASWHLVMWFAVGHDMASRGVTHRGEWTAGGPDTDMVNTLQWGWVPESDSCISERSFVWCGGCRGSHSWEGSMRAYSRLVY
jgi:hypothetical protein